MGNVAVIDIGSNSIKILVAARDAQGLLQVLQQKTLEARISAGISQQSPLLSEAGIERGIGAVKELLVLAAGYAPTQTILVATSAVRDAANGHVFRDRVVSETGHTLRILSGEEEANLIGRGLTSDPALGHLRDFYVFDLGGGSLECLSFRDRKITQAVSLRLGCVRLTERYVADPTKPFEAGARLMIAELTREVLAKSGFHFNLPPTASAVGTGGTVTTARTILGARAGKTLLEASAWVTTQELRELLLYSGRETLDDRRLLPGMPSGRADVLPAALATLIAVAEIGGLHAFHHSLCNLRFGVADEALGACSA